MLCIYASSNEKRVHARCYSTCTCKSVGHEKHRYSPDTQVHAQQMIKVPSGATTVAGRAPAMSCSIESPTANTWSAGKPSISIAVS